MYGGEFESVFRVFFLYFFPRKTMRKVCFIVENILRYMNDERSARGRCVNNRFQTGFIFCTFFLFGKNNEHRAWPRPAERKNSDDQKTRAAGSEEMGGRAENSYFRVLPYYSVVRLSIQNTTGGVRKKKKKTPQSRRRMNTVVDAQTYLVPATIFLP